MKKLIAGILIICLMGSMLLSSCGKPISYIFKLCAIVLLCIKIHSKLTVLLGAGRGFRKRGMKIGKTECF